MTLTAEQIEGRLRENIARVRERIAEATRRAGRGEAPRLVAVTKYVEPGLARMIAEAGVRDLGESRPQELWRKAEALKGLESATEVRWHLIGHLQRNKVARTVPLTACIHSVDSWRLLEAIAHEAVKQDLVAEVLLEVNVAGDESKSGMAAGELEGVIEQAGGLAGVRVAGLMAMASLTGGVEVARRNFAELRELRERVSPSAPPNVVLKELSMGMSEDFEVAIEEGATMVRVGSALFAGVE